MSIEDIIPDAISLSQHQHGGLGTSPFELPCHDLVDIQDTVTPARVPTFATQVFSDGLSPSFEWFNAYVPSEISVLETDDSAFESPDGQPWNVSYQQCVASSDNHIDTTLMSYDGRSSDLLGIGEFNTMVPPRDDSGDFIVSMQDGDIDLVPGWAMNQPPQPYSGSLPPSSLPEHHSAMYPVFSLSEQLPMNSSSSYLPLAPPILEQASRSYSEHKYWTPSASTPATAPDSSSYAYLDTHLNVIPGSGLCTTGNEEGAVPMTT